MLKTQICVTRPQCVKMDFKETESEGVDWIHMAQNGDTLWPLVNKIMERRDVQNAGKVLRYY